MSALVVHSEHIHVLIWAALRPIAGSYQELTWHYGNPTHIGRLGLDNRNEIGHMLLTANTASVNHTYRHHTAQPEYTYQPPQHTEWSPGEILQAIHAYEHQADEQPDWPTSQAHQFCRALERHTLRFVAGYNQGPWLISPEAVPLLNQRKAATLARQQHH